MGTRTEKDFLGEKQIEYAVAEGAPLRAAILRLI